MAILIQVKREGKIIHQCDKRCYGSKSKRCRCICKGVLHNLPKNSAICRLRTIKAAVRYSLRNEPDLVISFY